jgi:hypothetical protein
MEERDVYGLGPQGHELDPEPLALDLYRLLCMVVADRPIAKLSERSWALPFLQDRYRRSEITHALVSSAIALRIWLDQRDSREYDNFKTKCGKLYPNWPKQKNKVDNLTLREACNKIVHADDIRFDIVVPDRAHNPDENGNYLRPHIYLYGVKGNRRWRAKLSIIEFVRWGAAVFQISLQR